MKNQNKNYVKLKKFIFEEIERKLSEEMDDNSEMEQDFADALKDMAKNMNAEKSNLQKKQNDKEEVKTALKNAPDLAKVASNYTSESKKKKINEVDAVFFVGLALALPKLAEIAADITDKLSKKLGGGDKTKIAEFLRTSAHKLHHTYIKIVKIALLAVPSFRKADTKIQNQVAEIIFTVIIAGLAVYSGYNAVKAGISTLGALEGAMAAVKSGEVAQFLSKQFASIV